MNKDASVCAIHRLETDRTTSDSKLRVRHRIIMYNSTKKGIIKIKVTV